MTRPDPDPRLDSVNNVDGDDDRPVCAGCEDRDLWFDPDRADLARSLCRSCPVQAACLTGAVRRGEEWGVWGGQLFQPSDQPAARPVADSSAVVVMVPSRPPVPHRPIEVALRARPRVAAALAVLRVERAAGAAGGPEAA